MYFLLDAYDTEDIVGGQHSIPSFRATVTKCMVPFQKLYALWLAVTCCYPCPTNCYKGPYKLVQNAFIALCA